MDNTIIDYRNSFWNTALSSGIFLDSDINSFSVNKEKVPSKNQIKQYLKFEQNNDYKWESLQGLVYGSYMRNAKIYSGFTNFLIQCKIRDIKIYIVSHKTEFGHHDKSQTPLRKAALNFLKQNDILSDDYGLSEKDIFFCDLRSEKVNKIAELNCNYFIDDLKEVFSETNFPNSTKQILFDINAKDRRDQTFSNWCDINSFFFGIPKLLDISAFVKKGLNKKVKQVQKLKGRGNSRVYKIEMSSGKYYAGKLYPNSTLDNRNRLEKETKAYKLLRANGIDSVPECIWVDENLNFGIFEWIDGDEIEVVKDENIRFATEFISILVDISKRTNYKEFDHASAACFSGMMIEEQIRNRYTSIYNYSKTDSDLAEFLEYDFSKVRNSVLNNSRKEWPGKFESFLSEKFQILSPSDFGFHNTLVTKKGLKFFDLEYFGWDDPVKLTCDFLLHPAMDLTDSQKNYWIKEMKQIFLSDKNFYKRMESSYCMYGLCWCLIILNVFKSDKANDIELKTKRLKKSKKLLKHIKKVDKYGFYYG